MKKTKKKNNKKKKHKKKNNTKKQKKTKKKEKMQQKKESGTKTDVNGTPVSHRVYYYAVARGAVPGIYRDDRTAREQIHEHSFVCWKRCRSHEEALHFIVSRTTAGSALVLRSLIVCGHVGTNICGHVGMWACGHVGTWARGHVRASVLVRTRMCMCAPRPARRGQTPPCTAPRRST